MAKNIEDRVKIVNRFLAEAFGKGTKGNYNRKRALPHLRALPHSEVDSSYETSPQLEKIIKKGLFGMREIGSFTSPDGSSLVLHKRGFFGEYEISARIYSELYKGKYGEEVSVVISGQE